MLTDRRLNVPILVVFATVVGCEQSIDPPPKPPETFKLTGYESEDEDPMSTQDMKFALGVGDPTDSRIAAGDLRISSLTFNNAHQLPGQFADKVKPEHFGEVREVDGLAPFRLKCLKIPLHVTIASMHLQERTEDGVWSDIGEPIVLPEGAEIPVDNPYFSGNPPPDPADSPFGPPTAR